MTFSAIFLAALGGVTEAIAGKSIDAGPALARRARLLGMVERQPAGAAEQAVDAAVEATRQEVIDLYAFTEEALQAGEVQDLLRLLNHPPFAQEVSQALLLRGQPDFDRLRQRYLSQDGMQSERWTRLQPYLDDFFSAIESHLIADPSLGPLLRESRVLAVQLRLAEDMGSLNAASQQMVDYQARTAEAGEETATGIAGLLAAAGRQEASLGEIVQLLAGWQADSGPVDIDQREQRVLGNQVIVTGTATTVVGGNVEQIGDRYYAPPPDPAEQRAIEAERRYLRLLRQECNRLPLAEESRAAGDQHRSRAELANVYVDLQTGTAPTLEQIFDRLHVPAAERPALRRAMKEQLKSGERANGQELSETAELLKTLGSTTDAEKHPLRRFVQKDEELAAAQQNLTALEALAAHPHLVLLGHPGGGKSTFVNHLAYVAAGGLLGEEAGWSSTLGNTFATPPFPLRVILRRWSASLHARSRAGLPLAYAALRAATGLDQRALERRLALPDTLVLFDGLDEAPAANPDDPTAPDRRQLIAHSVQAFCTAHPECRVLVTSRVKPYEQGSARLEAIPVATLAELDDPRIRRFVTNWYRELARIDPERAEWAGIAEKRLQIALGQRPALREMAGTPLLLTMLAAVNTWAGLPESRAELYDKCVEQLLWEWEKKKESNLPGDGENGTALGLVDLLREPGVALQRADVERVLWELTFHAHAQSGAETADLPAADLRAALAAIHPKTNEGWAWANRVVGLMAERGGLLVESATDIFTFPHRSFQEYMAARWLLTDTERAKKAAQLAESDTWREVVLLACGYLTQQGRKEDVQALIAEVTGGDGFATPVSRRRLLTGGMAWLEYNSPPRATGAIGRLLTAHIPPRLTGLMQAADAPPAQRLEAGLILADLGDRPPDLDEFVPIEAKDALGYDFKIGKYPVTNAQFRRFFDAGGYAEDRPWWTPEAVKDIERFSKDWRKGPRYWENERFNKATQPVVGVSWYEAVAYCAWLTGAWLTGELRGKGQIGQNEVVRLAKEAEWAFVAAPPGPPSNSPRSSAVLSLSKEGRADRSTGQKKGQGSREYAWGDGFENWRVNSEESGHGQTTPVHMHPGGATPETAVWDLCGNVWEWGADDGSLGKMLLGGSFYTNAESVRASSRVWNAPWYWYNLVGLRCVVVPGSR